MLKLYQRRPSPVPPARAMLGSIVSTTGTTDSFMIAPRPRRCRYYEAWLLAPPSISRRAPKLATSPKCGHCHPSLSRHPRRQLALGSSIAGIGKFRPV
jgi:hypothetical protein